MAPGSDAARRVLADAIRARVFPAATVDVGSSAGPIWQDALGTLSFEAGAPPAALDTPFDLASLTKPIATTSVLMQLVAVGAVTLAGPVSSYFPEWTGADRQDVTTADVLEHASGLSARLLDAPPLGRREFEHEICMAPLEYAPRTRSIYSDLGFILLGFLAEDRAGTTLANQFEAIATGVGAPLTYGLPEERRREAAPTTPLLDDVRRGRVLVGEVHDSYAAALGGVAGHTGLFGTAAAVGVFARAVLNAARGRAGLPSPFSPHLVGRFTARSAVPGSSRALGWDTMLITSSCGARMSPSAFGHVGFTGTSLWIDPERDRYFVLLTNRAHGGGSLAEIRDVRRAFHDSIET